MKLIIERSALLRALGHIQSVVERRNTIPILSNVRMEAGAEGLALNATDMDIEIIETVEADCSVPGAATAPAHTLHEIVRKLPDGSQVELSIGGDSGLLQLRAGRSRFSLSCLPVEDFPALGSNDFSHRFTLTAADLRGLIDRTRFAISTEETRYYLNGIHFHATQSEGVDVMRAVATDGHRLARVEVPLPDGAAGMPGIIVPRKAVIELRKLIDETGMDVGVALSDHKIQFTFDDCILTSKLIDGTFPDYERVIPSGNDKILEVECKTLAAAADRVSAISMEKSRAIKMTMQSGSIVLSANSPDSGSAEEEVEAAYEADSIDIGFNSKYLLDILHQVEGDAVRMTFSESSAPSVLRDVADGSAVYVLMPMRV